MSDKQELLHTLKHEFGHAVGIGHLNNPNAIMYYQTNNQLDLTRFDIAALKEVCQEKTIFEITADRIVSIGQIVERTFQQYELIP